MFIAEYENNCGCGETLEEALKNLELTGNYYRECSDEVTFYEANEIEVQFKIVKVEKPVKVKSR